MKLSHSATSLILTEFFYMYLIKIINVKMTIYGNRILSYIAGCTKLTEKLLK